MKLVKPMQPQQDNDRFLSKPRVLVIGLDGGTFDVIQPLVAEGRLPNLARLMRHGFYSILSSTYPPITPSAWTSFATGKNPGQHGLYDFLRVNPETLEFSPVPARQHGHKSLWRTISDRGGKVAVLDVPFTYPPEEVNGCILTGYGTPEIDGLVFTYPPKLQEELAAACGSCDLAFPRNVERGLQPSLFESWDKILKNRSCIAAHLMDRIDWDCYMIVYGVTDHMQHVLWPFLEPQHPAYYEERGAYYREKLFTYYEKVDSELGKLLDRCDDQTHVIVMSDHGFGSTPTPKYLTKLLVDAGWLQYKSNPLSDRLMKTAINAYYSLPFLSRLVRKLSGRQKAWLKKTLTTAAIFPTPETIDWQNTKAFPGGYGLQVYINQKGRFSQGTVAPGAECRALQEEIANRLLSLTDPVTGQPIIKAVHRAQDIYSGSKAASAPELIVEYNNVYSPDKREEVNGLNNSLEGNHVMEGIFIAYGPNVVQAEPLTVNIIDIAPTVLYLLGLPVPEDMDGRVVTEIIGEERLRRHPIRYAETATTTQVKVEEYTEEEAELVREQLRALGYIE
jgi:predicted AlkP superfamily phosphohydrolase/phosphomutase